MNTAPPTFRSSQTGSFLGVFRSIDLGPGLSASILNGTLQITGSTFSGSFLPLSGGQLTGPLSGTSVSMSAGVVGTDFTANGIFSSTFVPGTNQGTIHFSSSSPAGQRILKENGSLQLVTVGNNPIQFYTSGTSNLRVSIDGSGSLSASAGITGTHTGTGVFSTLTGTSTSGTTATFQSITGTGAQFSDGVTVGSLSASAGITGTNVVGTTSVSGATGNFSVLNAGNTQVVPLAYTVRAAAASGNSVYTLDSRAIDYSPVDRNHGLYVDFKQNTTDGLADGGTYHGLLTFRAYGSGTDLSGGPVHELGFTSGSRIWLRTSLGTGSWNAWSKLHQDGDSGSFTSVSASAGITGSGGLFADGVSAASFSASLGITGSGFQSAGPVSGTNGMFATLTGTSVSGTTATYGTVTGTNVTGSTATFTTITGTNISSSAGITGSHSGGRGDYTSLFVNGNAVMTGTSASGWSIVWLTSTLTNTSISFSGTGLNVPVSSGTYYRVRGGLLVQAQLNNAVVPDVRITLSASGGAGGNLFVYEMQGAASSASAGASYCAQQATALNTTLTWNPTNDQSAYFLKFEALMHITASGFINLMYSVSNGGEGALIYPTSYLEYTGAFNG